jgi:hypothetical protein
MHVITLTGTDIQNNWANSRFLRGLDHYRHGINPYSGLDCIGQSAAAMALKPPMSEKTFL